MAGEYYAIHNSGNSQTAETSSQSPEFKLTAHEEALLAELPAGELRAILERIMRQYGHSACRTEEETAQAVLDRLATFALVLEAKEAIQAAKEWFDRTKGKPPQAILQASVVRLEHVEGELDNLSFEQIQSLRRILSQSMEGSYESEE